ncbi:folylpolyglutamate synthase/dihydrofolate synthase family protein [Gordonia sp. CPCC 206044]|uniref:bifunctional tetrahydrofolate synthase/dihydrofolate synthase n=1 Tax=Gordonia sp. CPCC 206044 TaxID=3140793 RepID=UPI003AF33B74
MSPREYGHGSADDEDADELDRDHLGDDALDRDEIAVDPLGSAPLPTDLGSLLAGRGGAPDELYADDESADDEPVDDDVPGSASSSGVAHDDAATLAELAEVEAELDTRWPETKIEPSLTRISALMDLLGSPQHSYPAIHIAGTNGKTSVTRMIDALLIALHRRTGRITSPHLQRVTERISVDGRPIGARTYIDTYRELEPYITMIDDSSTAAGGPRMSKFEVLIAMSYAVFAEAPVDVAVVETGMGGRWDATNVIDATVAVITPIAMDHADYLGDTLSAIASEKAGIIKKGSADELVPVDPVTVIATQEPEVMDVLLRQTVEAETIVARQNSEFAVLESVIAVGGQMLRLQGLGGVYDEVYLPLHGAHQAANAALALAAVEAFFGAGADRQLDIEAVREGFSSVASPGRLERVRGAPTVFIDAAHNPHGATALAQALAEEFDFRRLVGVIGMLGDKDAEGFLEAVEPVFDTVVLTNNGSPRALETERLAEIALPIFGEDRVVLQPFLPDAVETAIGLAEESDGEPVSGAGVVITGSVVTAGAARTLFGKEPT